MAVPEETVSSEDVRDTDLDTDPDICSILTCEQAQQYEHFREELRHCKAETERYELCAQKRDDLLAQKDNLQVLFAVYEQAMSVGCTECKRLKENKTKARKPLPSRPKDDSTAQWDRFFKVATDGSRHLTALKEVARCWNGPDRDVVQHPVGFQRGKVLEPAPHCGAYSPRVG